MKRDCKYYTGHTPCVFHKKEGLICEDCKDYRRVEGRILIIKLGAKGDVLRTTPLLRRLKEEYPSHEISWLSYFPDILPGGWIDNILEFNIQNIVWLREQRFDWIINLDKDREAIALAGSLDGAKKSGFTMDGLGKCAPISTGAERSKWLTGVRDDLSRANTRNYMEEIFEICGYRFNGERYVLDVSVAGQWDSVDRSKRVVGLNTGCGDRWPSRLWPETNWTELSRRLKEKGYEVVLLGGPREDTKNRKIAKKAQVKYPGHFPLRDYFSLVNTCNTVVTQVSLSLHIAIALDKKVVLMNNIFNKNEFHLYGNGTILMPDLNCTGCYKPRQDSGCPVAHSCMDLITVDAVLAGIERA